MNSGTIILVKRETGVFIGAVQRGDDGKYVFLPGAGPERGSWSEELLRWIADQVRKANADERKDLRKNVRPKLG